eukprot:m.38269 g.38269  ORF g.38269 m.38269 type:complete len:63 (+) comp45232_c0_seq4:436-624(+)
MESSAAIAEVAVEESEGADHVTGSRGALSVTLLDDEDKQGRVHAQPAMNLALTEQDFESGWD